MGKQLKDALQAAGWVDKSKTAVPSGKATAAGSQNAKRSAERADRDPRHGLPGRRSPLQESQTVVRFGGGLMPIPTRSTATATPLLTRAVAASEQARQPEPDPVGRRPGLVKIGNFHPNPLLDPTNAERIAFPALNDAGIAAQLTANPENQADLILGMDFGTSTTKVVVRDRWAAMGVFPIRFHPDQPGVGACLVSSRVFKTGGLYSLTDGAEDVRDLKLRLLACKSACPVTEFNDCCAFLALMIRRARATFLATYRDIYSRHQLDWRLNLGLAARSYEDAHVVSLFRRLAWAAMRAASDANAPEITSEIVELYRQLSYDIFNEEGELAESEDSADVVPEVSAQILGFMASARWDWSSRPVMMLVDVGAGTVDSALFHVHVPAERPATLTFYSNRVEPNGVMNLHRARVEWLQGLLPSGTEHMEARAYLEAIALPTGRVRPIPNAVAEYVPGYRIDVLPPDVDEKFRFDRLRRQVVGSVNDAKVKKGLGDSQLGQLPLLLCGGGARMKFYGCVADEINSTPGWGAVRVESMRLPIPDDMVATGLNADDFDRLSVAYGLSLSGPADSTLGRIVRSIEVPDIHRHRVSDDGEDRFVSKDQT